MPTLHLCHPTTAPTGLPLLHIMARPTPEILALTGGRCVPELALRDGEDRESYMLRLFTRLEAWHTPEWLQDDLQSPLTGSVALCCTCTPAEARNDRCHRAWAAAVLMLAGWEVRLD